MTPVRRSVVTALVLALAAAACGTSGEKDRPDVRDKISVSGHFGDKPTIKIGAPLKITETTSWTTSAGKGARIGPDATTILGLTLADARTGKTVISTHDKGQRPLEIKLGDQVFPSLAKSLVGKTADSRVVVASTSDDAYGATGAPQIGVKGGDPIVMVADVLSTDPTSLLHGPTGASSALPPTAPKIEESGDRLTGLDFRGLKKPTRYAAILLRQGTGPRIDAPDRIAADYLGEVWGARKPFNNTYGAQPARFSIGLGGVIKGWDRGLTGLRQGARVMLLLPPQEAYGKTSQPGIPGSSTLVFVIDVLGVG